MNCLEQSVVHCKETDGWPKRNLGWKNGINAGMSTGGGRGRAV